MTTQSTTQVVIGHQASRRSNRSSSSRNTTGGRSNIRFNKAVRVPAYDEKLQADGSCPVKLTASGEFDVAANK